MKALVQIVDSVDDATKFSNSDDAIALSDQLIKEKIIDVEKIDPVVEPLYEDPRGNSAPVSWAIGFMDIGDAPSVRCTRWLSMAGVDLSSSE